MQHAGPSLFPYESAESVWNEHRESTRGRDLDITGLTYSSLEQQPQQWPVPSHAEGGQVRLYEDGVFATPDGRAQFAPTPYRPVAEPRDARYPFSLNTGRLRDQWHGMSRTGTLGRLFGHVPEPAVQMHAQDMARRGLNEGDLVHVTSRRGSIVLPVQASAEGGLSQAFIAMHWGEEFLSGQGAQGQRLAGVNALTAPAFCPTSKQPELKHCAVKILKAELPWTLLAVAWLPAGEVLNARAQAQALMAEFSFASGVLFAGQASLSEGASARTGLLFRAAHHEPVAAQVLDRLEQIFGLQGAAVLRYADAKKGQRRAVRLERNAVQAELTGFLLAGDTRAQAWIKTLLQDELPAQDYGRQLLAPGAQAPLAVASRGMVVCSCLNVTDLAIAAHLNQCQGDAVQRLQSLQAALLCGSNCGSCVPQLQGMVRASI
jgi:assimilatory nitrate reductase catalytic subunit